MGVMPAAAPGMAAPGQMLGQAHPRFAQAAMANPGALAQAVSKYRNGGVDGRAPRITGKF